jgi:hypothetical protein
MVLALGFLTAIYFFRRVLLNVELVSNREIFAEQNKLSGHVDRDSVVDSVPRCLVELVLITEHGPDIKSQIENGLAKSDFAIAQLLYYNNHKKGRQTTSSSIN